MKGECASFWSPLESALGLLTDADAKFEGLCIASRLGLPVPTGCYVSLGSHISTTEIRSIVIDLLAWIEERENRTIGSVDTNGVPLLLSVRFGDKYTNPALPPSVSNIGAGDKEIVFHNEYRSQLLDFCRAVGVSAESLPSTDVVETVTQIIRHGARHLSSNRVNLVVQRSACSFGIPYSGHGNGYTRDPETGAEVDFGRFAWNCSGRAYDSGLPTELKRPIGELRRDFPDIYWQLRSILAMIECYYEDTRQYEFVIENSRVFLVQVTPRRRKAGTFKYPRRRLPIWKYPSQFATVEKNSDVVACASIEFGGLQIHLRASRDFKDIPVNVDAEKDQTQFTLQGHSRNVVISMIKQDYDTSNALLGTPISIERKSGRMFLMGRVIETNVSRIINIPQKRAIVKLLPEKQEIIVAAETLDSGSDIARRVIAALFDEYAEISGWKCLDAVLVHVEPGAWLVHFTEVRMIEDPNVRVWLESLSRMPICFGGSIWNVGQGLAAEHIVKDYLRTGSDVDRLVLNRGLGGPYQVSGVIVVGMCALESEHPTCEVSFADLGSLVELEFSMSRYAERQKRWLNWFTGDRTKTGHSKYIRPVIRVPGATQEALVFLERELARIGAN